LGTPAAEERGGGGGGRGKGLDMIFLPVRFAVRQPAKLDIKDWAVENSR